MARHMTDYAAAQLRDLPKTISGKIRRTELRQLEKNRGGAP